MKIINSVILVLALSLMVSCAGSKDVAYFQDLANSEAVTMKVHEPLRFVPGDKLTLVVTSHSTPHLAEQYNLTTYQPLLGTTEVTIAMRNQVGAYTVSEEGTITIPVLGTVSVKGLTVKEISDYVQDLLRKEQLRDAVVVAQAFGQYVSVLGEVSRPGRIAFDRNSMTLLEALGQVGDLTIKARRDQVLVVRQEGGKAKSYWVDLRSKNLFKSPVYHLKQNDVIYVVPNKARTGEATINDNSFRSVSTWISFASLLITLGVVIFK